jgi:hypothetical protein
MDIETLLHLKSAFKSRLAELKAHGIDTDEFSEYIDLGSVVMLIDFILEANLELGPDGEPLLAVGDKISEFWSEYQTMLDSDQEARAQFLENKVQELNAQFWSIHNPIMESLPPDHPVFLRKRGHR